MRTRMGEVANCDSIKHGLPSGSHPYSHHETLVGWLVARVTLRGASPSCLETLPDASPSTPVPHQAHAGQKELPSAATKEKVKS